MRGKLDKSGLDLMFREARSANGFTPEKIADALINEIYDLTKLGPTSANCSPARFIFVTTPAGKEKLKPCIAEGNLAKTMAAPVTVVIGYDTKFYEHMAELFPHAPGMKEWFSSSPEMTFESAFRNGSLQGAYLIMAARSLGLDAGPMSGFDAAKCNEIFWPDGRVKANFLCNIGHGDDSKVFGRLPRHPFARVCQVI